ncbi:unnamed protein product [Closterium sp. NIES-54]
MPYLTFLEAHHNYLTATAGPLPVNVTGLVLPYHSLCLFHHNCLENNSMLCGRRQAQRRASECRAFCGAQPLTPPCSGHGVCSSFVPNPSHHMTACEDDEDEPPPPSCQPAMLVSLMRMLENDPSLDVPACDNDDQPPPRNCQPRGQCDCDEGYTPGTAAGTCVSHGTAVMEMALAALQTPQNILLLLLAVLQLAFALPLFLRRLKHHRLTRYSFSKRALAGRQAAMDGYQLLV